MALKLEKKQEIALEVNKMATEALSLVVADYRGLTSSEMTKLRADARNSGVKLKIVRNTLACRAFSGTPYECMQEVLVGPVLLAFADKEPGATARLVRDFAKDHEKLGVRALSLGGKLLAAGQLEAVAKLPTYDEAIARLLSVMKAPIEKFVRTLAEPKAKLVRVLAAIRDQKQAY